MLKQDYYLELFQEIDSFLEYANRKVTETNETSETPVEKWDVVNHTDYLNALKMKQDLLDKIKF